MIICDISIEKTELYYHLVPARVLGQIDGQTVFGLAAYDEKRGNYPAAAMAFSVTGDAIEILWFYVAEDYRRQGVGNLLLGEFFTVTASIPYESIHISVPDIPGAEQTLVFFTDYTFSFEQSHAFELQESLEKLTSRRLSKRTTAHGKEIVRLSSVIKHNAVSFLEEYMGFDAALKLYAAAEKNISTVHLKDTTPVGVCIFAPPEGNVLQLLELKDISDTREFSVQEMLRASCIEIQHTYKFKPEIYFKCGNGFNGELIDFLCPDIHPVKIWKGVYHTPKALI